MPITMPNQDMYRDTVFKSDVVKASVLAVAFNSKGHIITKAVNKAVFGVEDTYTLHAEHLLVNKLRKINAHQRYNDINVIVLRWSREEKRWTMAKPCPDCTKIMKSYGVDNIYYTDFDANIQQLQEI
jgi:tRNA(Arg) A34 adenosine deaminase TadA